MNIKTLNICSVITFVLTMAITVINILFVSFQPNEFNVLECGLCGHEILLNSNIHYAFNDKEFQIYDVSTNDILHTEQSSNVPLILKYVK